MNFLHALGSYKVDSHMLLWDQLSPNEVISGMCFHLFTCSYKVASFPGTLQLSIACQTDKSGGPGKIYHVMWTGIVVRMWQHVKHNWFHPHVTRGPLGSHHRASWVQQELLIGGAWAGPSLVISTWSSSVCLSVCLSVYLSWLSASCKSLLPLILRILHHVLFQKPLESWRHEPWTV